MITKMVQLLSLIGVYKSLSSQRVTFSTNFLSLMIYVFSYGGVDTATFCLLASQAMQLEYDNTANVYTYAKIYHNKRPGIWQSVDNLKVIFRILSYLPSDLTLLKCTEIRTELDDVTTATPDLYSKICSNGNISSTLNSTQNPIINADGKMNGGLYSNGNDEFSVVVTEPDNVNV